MKRTVCLLCLLPAFGAMVFGQAFARAPRGERLATACSACHGPQGRSHGTIPSLAGMTPAHFTRRMAEFRRGDGTIMNRIVPAYDRAEVAALARYFATQSPPDSQ